MAVAPWPSPRLLTLARKDVLHGVRVMLGCFVTPPSPWRSAGNRFSCLYTYGFSYCSFPGGRLSRDRGGVCGVVTFEY